MKERCKIEPELIRKRCPYSQGQNARSVRDKYGVVGLPELAVRCSEQIWQTVIAKLEFEGHKGYLRLLLEEAS